jgi:spore germination cell wall hydrolase CwlJ-like protein
MAGTLMAAIDYSLFQRAVFLTGILLLAGCTSSQTTSAIKSEGVKASAPIGNIPKKQLYNYTASDRECLKRAMYFESKRSSRDGLMAVGTVVMNRMTSGAYPSTICGVVGQERQFAPGVMTRPLKEQAAVELDEAADAILRGERNPQVKEAMFFHRAGLRFPYDNMHYVTVAGGNAFYEKRGDDGELQTPAPKPADEYILSFAPHLSTSPALMAVNDVQQASVVAEADDLPLPLQAPVPLQRPQLASLSSSQMVMAPQVWSLPATRK